MTFTREQLEEMVGAPIAIGPDGIARKVVPDEPRARAPLPRRAGKAAKPSVRPPTWLEKDEQRECWRLLLACGFKAKWLSQARRSEQTKGIPDLLARHVEKRLIVWIEVKNPDDPAEWTPEQQDFAAECIEEKETYILGGEAELRAWLRTQGWDL